MGGDRANGESQTDYDDAGARRRTADEKVGDGLRWGAAFHSGGGGASDVAFHLGGGGVSDAAYRWNGDAKDGS